MTAKQISVFIENRKGRIGDVLKVLKGSDVNILSLSIADTSEYGLFRIIVDKPETGKKALSEAGFSAMLSDIFIISVPHEPGSLHEILQVISDEEISVEYMYGLSVAGEEASIVLKTSDTDKAMQVFKKHGVKTLLDKELF
jgi:hypothetical protein